MISVTDSRNIGQMLRRRPSSAPPLVPIGSGSRLSVLPETVEKLDLSPLRTLEKLDRDELVVTAEAATPLGEVSAAAAECGAILCPLIPLKSPGTLGGLYVDGLESPLAPVEGPTRHAVLGVEGFTGNGDPIKSGGLVVKNVTGYDLTRFLAGSKGTLAVVTRIHWRLRRAPAALRELTYRFCPTELEEQLVRLRMAPDAAGVRLEAVKDELKLRLLLEGSTRAVEARRADISEALGEPAAQQELRLEDSALADWFQLELPGDLISSGPVPIRETRSTRGWIDRVQEWHAEQSSLQTSSAAIVAFPFAGPGIVRGGEVNRTAPNQDVIVDRVRSAWDPQNRLWNGRETTGQE